MFLPLASLPPCVELRLKEAEGCSNMLWPLLHEKRRSSGDLNELESAALLHLVSHSAVGRHAEWRADIKLWTRIGSRARFAPLPSVHSLCHVSPNTAVDTAAPARASASGPRLQSAPEAPEVETQG